MGLSRILVVDDVEFSRVLLEKQLTRMGYEVATAKDGEEAWAFLEKETANFVITDWMMPGISGVELCRRIRSTKTGRYTYIILLTSKGDETDLVVGMEAGADDFMRKPYNPSELKVKINAGERVLNYETVLIRDQEELRRAHDELNRTYDIMKKNLGLAGNLQKALLPRESISHRGILFESFFIPCHFVAGDIYNFFKLKDDQYIFYLLDVAGHGIPAAMLSFTLSHVITPLPYNEGAQTDAKHIFLDFSEPAEVASDLNRVFQGRTDDQYFTMIYGLFDFSNHKVRFTQAGHPPMIHLPWDGAAKPVGEGGFPLGIFNSVNYEVQEFDVAPGDRLFLYSDGITECPNPDGKAFSIERLMDIIYKGRDRSLHDSLTMIRAALGEWHGSAGFEDDLSLFAMEFGPWSDEDD